MPRSRKPLSRERILETGLALADKDGIDALSMRKLGQALGFEAMSLYNHVANKEELLGGMLDVVFAEIEPPTPEEGMAGIRRGAISAHAALKRHPWAAGLLMAPASIRPARLKYMDALLGSLRAAGFSAETTYHAYHVLDAHVIGFSLWESTHDFSLPEGAGDIRAFMDTMLPPKVYPDLNEHGRQHMAETYDDVSTFEFSLDLLLESLERLRAA